MQAPHARQDHPGRRPGQSYAYYVCPTHPGNPADAKKHPGHVRAAVCEDTLTAALSQFLDDFALGYDRAANLAELFPAARDRHDTTARDRTAALARQLRQADTAMNGIAAEMARLAGKTDPMSNAIPDRLTAQFSDRYDRKTAIEAEQRAIEDAPPPGNDLSLLDELPYATGLLAAAPAGIRENIAAAFDMRVATGRTRPGNRRPHHHRHHARHRRRTHQRPPHRQRHPSRRHAAHQPTRHQHEHVSDMPAGTPATESPYACP